MASTPQKIKWLRNTKKVGLRCILRCLRLEKGNTPWDNIYFTILAESRMYYLVRTPDSPDAEYLVSKSDIWMVKQSGK